VGKGEGKIFPCGNAYRTPMPTSGLKTKSHGFLVGTANAWLSLDEVQCHRLCPPYEVKGRR
jgi:hypothetical protein